MEKHPRIEVYKDIAGEWRWRLVALNGKIVACSGEGFKSSERAKFSSRVASAIMAQASGGGKPSARPRASNSIVEGKRSSRNRAPSRATSKR